MKRFLLLYAIVLVSSGLFAQNILFQEGFEGTPAVTSGGTPLWMQNTTFFASGTKSYLGQIVLPGDSSVLITNAFSTLGAQKVILEFSHICKIEFLDAAEIYVSNNNGTTWTKLTETQYQGSGTFNATTNNRFSSATYPMWVPGTQATPANSWWMDEVFNISALVANSAQVRIMFMLRDMNNGTQFDNWGWLMDDIKVWTPSPQAAAITGIILPLSLPSGCGLTNETIQVRIANEGGQNINGNLTATFKREGQLAVTESVPTLIAPDDTITYTFTNTIDLSSLQDTTYEVKAWIALVGDNNQNNDTTMSIFDSRVALPDPVINDTTIPFGTSVLLHATHSDSIFWYSDPLGTQQLHMGSYFQTPVLLDTTIFYLQATGALPDVKITEVVQFETGTGYTNPYPTWITGVAASDFDGIEITNLGNGPADLSGWTVNFYSTDASWAVNGVFTYPNGTILPSGGISIIDVKSTSSVNNPSYFYYGAGLTGNPQSSSTQGYYIKNAQGMVVDAVAVNGQIFAGTTGVTAADWSGTIASASGRAGVSRLVSDNNDASDWGIAGINPTMQSFGTLNPTLTVGQGSGGSGANDPCPSRVVPVKVSVSGIPLNNAGIAAITSPFGPYPQGSIVPVTVNLKNFASDTLKKVTIHYSVNGIIKAPYLWTGNLPYNQIASVTIATDTFVGGAYTYRAWTSMPNDSVDGYTANDSALAMAYVCLAGNFTLGGANADFPDFASLFTILNNVGICGPTTITLTSGLPPITGGFEIGSIQGSSPQNTLTIIGNGNTINQGTQTYILAFNGTKHITITGFNLVNTTPSTNIFGVMIRGASQYITLDNNTINVGITSTSSLTAGIAVSNSTTSATTAGNNGQYLTITNNTIIGGYYGITLMGLASYLNCYGNLVADNIVKDFYLYGIYLSNNDTSIVRGNDISRPTRTTITTLYGIYATTSRNIKYIGNRIHTTGVGSYGAYPIYITTSSNTIGYETELINNAIYNIPSTSTLYGMYILGTNNAINFYYNSINLNTTGSSGAVRAMFFSTAPNNYKLRNNILHLQGTGSGAKFCIYVTTTSATFSSDYNNFYMGATAGTNNLGYWGANQLSFTNWKTATSQDANSLNIQTPFDFTTDITLANTLLSGKGIAIPGVTTDIFGNIRGSVPTIGAHEVPLISKDAGVTSFVLPTPQSVVSEGGLVQPIVTIVNFGTDTLYTCDVYCAVNQGLIVDTVYTGTLLPFQTATVTMPSFVSPAGNTSLCAWTVLPGDTNYFNDTTCMIYFATPTIDAIMTRIIPIDDGCGLGLDTVKVVIRNIGATTITGSFDVMYKLKGDTTVITQSASGPIAVNDSIHITFGTLADFTSLVDSLYEVISWVDVPGDNVAYNDTATLEVLSLKIPLPPIVSDTTIPYATYVTLFGQSIDSVMWYQYDTSTVELHTGAFYTTPILYDTTTYWVEASSGPSGMGVGSGVNIAPLALANASNCSTGPCSSFNDLNYGTCGTQQVWISTSGGPTPHVDFIDFEWPAPYSMDKITIHHGQTGTRFLSGGDIYYWNGTAWVYHYTFSNLPNTVCENDILFPVLTTTKFRITSFVISGTQLSNPNFREIEIFSAAVAGCTSLRVPVTVNVGGIPPYDLGISELAVKEGCAVYNEPVTIKIFNQGTDTLKGGATASYRINNNPYVPTETIPDTIAPGTSIYYTFSTLANLTAPLTADTMFTIKAWVNILGDPNQQNDTIVRDSIMSLETPAVPTVVTPVNIQYGTTATLTAQSPMPVEWFASDTASVKIDTGYTFVTQPLFDTTTFWAQAGSAMGPPTSLPTGAHGSNYAAAQTRGFHFTAPVSMTITELMVPTAVTAGPQYIQVVKFTGYPIVYPGGSPFVTLALITNAPFGVPQQVNIPIAAGDEIGIIGGSNSTGTTMNMSYGGTQVPSTIAGIPVVLTRLVYQSPLVSGPAATGTIGLEIASSIGRIDVTYVVGGLGCPSLRVPVVVNTSSPPPVDAGIEEIVNPHLNAASNVPHPIQVKLRNYGLATLTTANIVWSLNNVIQGTIPWTGSLVNGATQVVTLDTMTFAGGVYCIKAWSVLPNGLADTVPLNDTANHCFNACLAGVYTIGPATTGTWDYNTFNQAVNALTSVGICGHVIFDVQPGIYTEQLTINSFAGMNVNNTVTFRGATGDSTAVTLQYNAAGSTDYWTIRLNGADWFRFEKMTIKGLGITYARAIEFMAGADNNIISNCVVEVPAGTTSYYVPIYSTSSSNDHYNQFLNNRIVRGYYGMYWYGTSTTNLMKGTIIKGNVFEGWYYYGAYLYYHDSLEFTENIMTNLTGFANGYGLYAGYCQNDVKVTRNKIEVAPTGIMYGGIYMYYCTGTNARKGLIANNFISVTGANTTSVHYGVRLYYSNYQELLFNSVNVAAGAGTSRAIDVYYGGSNNILNNYGRNTSGGFAYYMEVATAANLSNYNNWYSSGSSLAYWGANCADLASLKLTSGKEANSHNLNVLFSSPTDLHLMSSNLSAKGQVNSRVPIDIDGEIRSSMPTIGADEVPLIPKDAGITAIIAPAGNTNEGQVYPVQVVITNFGTDTLFTTPVQYSVNGGTPVLDTFNGALPTFGTASMTLPSMTSPAGNSVICAKTLLPGDSNAFNDEFCKTFFATPINDARALRLVGLVDACNIGLDTISMWVKNQGVNPINSPSPSVVTASYRINGSATVITQNFTPVLMPNDSVLFHFTTLADFSVTTTTDTFYVQAWVDLAGDNVKYNDTANHMVISFHVPAAPIVSNVNSPYASPATLTASSPTNDPILWFTAPVGGSSIHTGNSFTTPLLYFDTTFYVESSTMTQVSGNFTSPSGFTGGTNCGGGFMLDITALNDDVTLEAFDINTTNAGSQTVNFFYRVGTWVGFADNQSAWIPWGTYTVNSPGANQATNLIINPLTIPQGQTYAIYYQVPSNYGSLSVNTTYSNGDISVMTGMAHCINWDGCCTPRMWNGRVYYTVGGFGCGSPRVPIHVTVTGQAANDVGVSAITQPVTAVNLSTQETVQVKVKNYGLSTQTNIPVSFKVDNLPAVTETIPGPLASGDSLLYSFVGKANLGLVGNTYQLKAYTGLTGDVTNLNDTAWKSVQNLFPSYCISTATSTGYEDLTNVTLHTLNNTSAAVGSMYTDFSSTVMPPMLSPGVSYPISISSGFPPSYSTQYSCWVKVWIDFNRNGVFDDPSEMIFSSATTSSNTVTGTVSIPPTALTGNTLMRVVFVETSVATSVNPCGTYTWGETEDYMVTINPLSSCDAGVIAIVEPAGTTQGGAVLPVRVVIMNFGSNPIAANTLSIGYVFNGGTPVITPYPGSLPTMGTDTVVLPNVTASMGSNTLCVYTILACDSTLFNNEICTSVYGQYYTSLPYFDDFEASNMWYKPATSVNWQYGTPSGTIISTAYSGNKAWVTNLVGDYTNNANEYLYTPIFDFTGLSGTDTITLSFYHFLAMAASDYGRVQYTIDGGQTWSNLGFFGDPMGTNWYNTQVGGVHYFSLTNTGWMYSAYKLQPNTFNGQLEVQFRFNLVTNASVTSNGWALDNFRLALPLVPNDVGITVLNYPVNDTAAGSQVNVQVTITNFGTNPQVMFPWL
jgi:hypothetical protein